LEHISFYPPNFTGKTQRPEHGQCSSNDHFHQKNKQTNGKESESLNTVHVFQHFSTSFNIFELFSTPLIDNGDLFQHRSKLHDIMNFARQYSPFFQSEWSA
jgi:hypothetical protein